MQTVLPGLHTFTGLVVGRVYLIEDPDGLTLVDTGLPFGVNRIKRQLAAAGHQPQDVKRILITHAHMDHVGGLAALQALTGAQVIASAAEQSAISEQNPPGIPVDLVVAEGDVLPVMGGLQVLFTPGHSPGHLCFWQPERRVVFCGDVIMRFARLSLPFAAVTPDMAANKRAIARLVALEPSVVCFGHGPVLQQNTAAVLRNFARRVGAVA